jgi:hypothetical protein
MIAATSLESSARTTGRRMVGRFDVTSVVGQSSARSRGFSTSDGCAFVGMKSTKLPAGFLHFGHAIIFLREV